MPSDHKAFISNDQIAALLSPFGVQLSGDQNLKVREYVSMLLKWNKLTNLTTIIDPAEVVSRHFGESLFLTTLLPLENGRLADIGSGAGFPGLALKILCHNLEVVLIESNIKKCAFLSEVARALEVRGVEIIRMRFEEIRREAGSFNFVTARAVGGFPRLLQWAKGTLPDRGRIALWVGGGDTTKISRTPGWTWQPAVHIPESQRRFILIGRPHP